jgi:hypothetical protein
VPEVMFGDFDRGFYLDDGDKLLSGDVVFIQRGEKKVVPPDTFTPYLQLPFNLSPEIKQMARAYESITDPREKVAKIKEDLALNYTYNIVTGKLDEYESFLDNFLLKTHQGYSVHFATAFIIIARYNNIPARYATGFLAIIPQPRQGQLEFGGYRTTISGLSTHVWPEIWYDKTGWTVEEVTPAVIPDSYTRTETGIICNRNITLNPGTQHQISGLMGEPVISGEEFGDFSFSINVNPVYILYGIGFIILILVVVRYAYIFVYIFRKNIHTVVMLLRKIIKKHKKKGYPTPADVGWVEWGERIKQNTPRYGDRIEEYIRIIIGIMYGEFKVKKQDVKAIFAFYRKVKTRKMVTFSASDL